MSKLKILSAAFGATLALSAVGSAFAIAPDDSNNPKKDYVCHFTSSAKNPLVIINVGNSAVKAHVLSPGHGGMGNDSSSNTRPGADGTVACGVGTN